MSLKDRVLGDKLLAAKPEMVVTYLEQHGWVRWIETHPLYGDNVVVYDSPDGQFTVDVPLHRNFRDYETRLMEVLRDVARYERRPFPSEQVLADILKGHDNE